MYHVSRAALLLPIAGVLLIGAAGLNTARAQPNPATVEVLDKLPPQVQYIGTDLLPPNGCVEFAPDQLRCNTQTALVSSDTFDPVSVNNNSTRNVTVK